MMFAGRETSKKILVIDDDLSIVKMLEDGLGTSGFSVISARDPKEGLGKAVQFRPDLVILDIILPVMDGYDVLEILKKDPQTKDIPVIMLTIKNQEEDISKGLKLGVDDYIAKPIHLGLLIRRIQNLLKM